ncbi:MAG: FKBP-type peptidyl-prolyl cis-trans isomerase [Lachnospiraceae bacterium]|nr:FKBP-type peptidyl-prolyl cis-trans isomerase [Lachnospiraceae bacterium]
MEKKNDENTAGNVSNSMKKRIDRANQVKKTKRSRTVGRVIEVVIILLIVAGIGFLIANAAIKASKRVTASTDYSKCLDANGYVKGVNAASAVTLPTYKGVSISNKDIEFTDEEVEEDIKSVLENHQELSTDTDKLIEDGDKINLDYVGSIDGVEFEGGNSGGNGYDLTIGSNSFIDDFEQQLIGHGIGENVTVNVTFPEDYQSEDLAGKDAVFECVINGIYISPEFTDEFVAENLSDKASTVEEYKKYLKDTHYEENLNNWIENYLKENTTAVKYPGRYLKNLKSTQKNDDMQSFQYMNQIYAQMYGQGYSDFYEYQGMTEEEYDESLIETCQETEKEILTYQAIMENEGIKLTIDDYKKKLIEDEGSDESYASSAETYGDGYLVQGMYKDKAIQIVKDNAVFTD